MDFNFISDEQFRSSLNEDYSEMQSCIQAGSWKAVHVLAGSIVEALLTEYLVVSGIRPGGKDPLKLTLAEIVDASLNAKVLQKSTASLCDVIREYRNLIHPGRMIRLAQKVTPEGGHIAVNLVSIIVREVAEKRKSTYGPTAEQIVRKLKTDQHSPAVLAQLLQETNLHERQRLVTSLIPEVYAEEEADFFNVTEDVQARLRFAYRQTLELLGNDQQRAVATNFARAIREESSEKIESYGEAFFLSSDISRLSVQDATIVTQYLRNRLDTVSYLSIGLMRQAVNLGCYIDSKDVSKFVDNLVRLLLKQPENSSDKAIDFAGRVFDAVDEDKKKVFEKRIGVWTKFAKEKDYSAESQERLAKLEMKWVDLPF